MTRKTTKKYCKEIDKETTKAILQKNKTGELCMKKRFKPYRLSLAIFGILVFFYSENTYGFNLNQQTETISGKARVVDGDTLEIQNRKIRLKDIDAVEKDQNCYKNNQAWDCGNKAKKFLEKTILSENVICIIDGIDFYRRFLATCYVNKSNTQINLNKLMVENGWALNYNSNKYSREEFLAKSNRKNIWSGEFEKPQDYRKNRKNRKQQ